MRDEWRDAFAETAAAYWSEDRLRELIGEKQLWIDPTNAPTLLRALGLLHRRRVELRKPFIPARRFAAPLHRAERGFALLWGVVK